MFDESDEQNRLNPPSEGYASWQEYRRQLAWKLVQSGMAQKNVAQLLNVTQAAVSQWVKKARDGGELALREQPYPERARKLAREHIERLAQMLEQGAQAHGFPSERWTLKHIAALIEESFGVTYHPSHVSRLLKQWGISVEEPQTSLSAG